MDLPAQADFLHAHGVSFPLLFLHLWSQASECDPLTPSQLIRNDAQLGACQYLSPLFKARGRELIAEMETIIYAVKIAPNAHSGGFQVFSLSKSEN